VKPGISGYDKGTGPLPLSPLPLNTGRFPQGMPGVFPAGHAGWGMEVHGNFFAPLAGKHPGAGADVRTASLFQEDMFR